MDASITPVQLRLSPQEVAILDRVAALFSTRMLGIKKASRPDALKWCFLRGAEALLAEDAPTVPETTVPAPEDETAAHVAYQRERKRRNAAAARARKKATQTVAE